MTMYLMNQLKHNISECLNLLAFNISGIPLHLDSCVDQCVNVNHIKFDVLAFYETRLNDAIRSLYSIEGYESILITKVLQQVD